MPTLPFAAATAAAVCGATLLLGGSAAAAPATDRDPLPPDVAVTVCTADGSVLTPREGAEPQDGWEPTIRCDPATAPPVAGGPAEPCVLAVPARPVEPGDRVERALPARPVEPGDRVERALPARPPAPTEPRRHARQRVPACIDVRVPEVVPHS